MSFLLNALKKSEQAARTGADSGRAGEPGNPRFTRSELALHLAWIVPACALGVWLGLYQLGVLSVIDDERGPGAGDSAAASGSADVAVKGGEPGGEGTPDTQADSLEARRAAIRAERQAAAQAKLEARRAAIRAERQAAAQAKLAARRAAQHPERAPATSTATTGTPQQAQQPREIPAARKAARQAAAQAKLEANRAAQRTAGNSGQPARQPAAARPAAVPAASGDYPGYWQLSDNVRRQLPELQISLLVFSETPADRFVLIDGSRQAEGDTLGNGLELQEIRRDGVLFRFRNQTFLVTP